MNSFYIILAACPVLFLGATAFLVMVAVGVRKGRPRKPDTESPESPRFHYPPRHRSRCPQRRQRQRAKRGKS
jgi:hypothetical protein